MFEREFNKAYMGMRIMGDIPMRGHKIVTISFPLAPSGTKIIIYDTNGNKLFEISDEIRENIIGEISFDLIESGCGSFRFSLLKDPPQEIKYNYRVDIHLFRDADPWFSGYILKRPIIGSTRLWKEYSGFGFFNQLETVMVDQAYNTTTFPAEADREVSKVADHIIQTFVEPGTDIVYDAAKIIATDPPFYVTDIDFDKIPAKRALQDLVDIAQNYMMGVDEERDFFFKPISTDVNLDAIKFVGKHLETFIPDEDVSQIRNKLYIRAGKITDKSNYIVTVQDTASQTKYGKREAVLTVPSALHVDDATRWGNHKLVELKDSIQKAKLKGIDLFHLKDSEIVANIIKAYGKGRIHTLEFEKETFPLVELDYFEYPDHATAQATYVSSDVGGIEENFETGGDSDTGVGDIGGNEYWGAGKIITSQDIICSDVSFYISSAVYGAPTGDLTYRLETDDATEPSGTLVHANATGTIPNGSLSHSAWIVCSFTLFNLPAGTYWLVLSVPVQETNVRWGWQTDADGGVNTRGYTSDEGVTWGIDNYAPYFRLYNLHLQCYSEDTIIQQGTYSLKGVAKATDSLNDTLTRTIDPPIDLSGKVKWTFYIYSNRTGSNIKVGLHDSGGVTTETTPNVVSAGAWQKVEVDISGVTDADKDAIDSIIVTVIEASSDNIFYFDNMFSPEFVLETIKKYELFIKKVLYKISSEGITADMELGDLFLPVSDEIIKLLRDLKSQDELQAANVGQLVP